MTIETINQIIGGKIITEGNEEVFRAVVYAKACEEGDLCFVTDAEEKETALAQKAGVLVCTQDLAEEKASCTQIVVEDIKDAAFKLAGEVVSEEDASLELLLEKEMTFLKMILVQKKSVEILPKDWKKAFNRLMESPKRLFLTTDEALFKAARKKKEKYGKKAPGHIVSADSLFRTTFKIDKYIYQYKQMTFFHLPALRTAVALCQEYELDHNIDKIGYTKHFRPVFLEGEPSVQDVMKNDKVVILSDNLEDILEGREYASDIGHWMAKTLVMVPPKTKVEGVKYPTYYHNEEDLLEKIEQLAYNYLFILTQEEGLWQKIQSRFC